MAVSSLQRYLYKYFIRDKPSPKPAWTATETDKLEVRLSYHFLTYFDFLGTIVYFSYFNSHTMCNNINYSSFIYTECLSELTIYFKTQKNILQLLRITDKISFIPMSKTWLLHGCQYMERQNL